MTSVTQVYETVLYASDLEAGIAFYAGVLGLRQLPRMGDRGAVFQVTDQAVLLLFDPARSTPAAQSVPSHGAVGEGHVAFSVPELDSWRSRFAHHGIPIEREIEWPLGGRSIYVRDPARNSVELVAGRVWDLPPPPDSPPALPPPTPSVAAPTASPPRSGDPLDLLLGHNAWATRELLHRCQTLTTEQWHQPFPMGPGSLHNTFTHIVAAMRYWADRISGSLRPVRPFLDHTTPRTVAEVALLLEDAVADLELAATSARTRGLDTEVHLTLGGVAYRFTLSAMLVHVTTHGMHHRAQCLNLLRHLDVAGISDHLPDIDVLEFHHRDQQQPTVA